MHGQLVDPLLLESEIVPNHRGAAVGCLVFVFVCFSPWPTTQLPDKFTETCCHLAASNLNVVCF